MKQKKKNDIAALLDYAGSHRGLTFLGLGLSAASMVCSMIPYLCIWLAARDLIEVAPNWTQAQSVARYGWLAFGAAFGGIVLYFGGLMCTHLAAFRTAANIRKQGVAHVMNAPLGWFDANASGLIRGRLDAAAADTETLLAHNLADIVGTITLFIAMLVLMFVFDWRMGLLCLLTMVLALGCMTAMMGGRNAGFFHRYQREIEKMSGEAVEYVRGIPVVKVFQQTVYSFKAFYNAIQSYSDLASQYAMSCRAGQTGFLTCINGAFALLIPAALLLSSGGNGLEVLADFIFYALFAPACGGMINRIMYASESVMEADEAMMKMDEILQNRPLPRAAIPQKPKGHDITFTDVTFRYPGAARPALDHVSFTVPEGSVAGLVGPSGGGKSTAAALIPRFWDVESGSVRIGGVDVRDMDPHVLMEQVAFVFQDTRLFKVSVLENIRMARPSATLEEIRSAAHAAQCDDILEKLPQGLDTVVGARGVYLSGGEQQRIALARAILKDAPIVVLDEATAFADPENERQIQKAFETLTRNKTVLMIAHRLSTVQSADNIIVLSEGRIAEQGSHSALLEKDGVYAAMWADYQRSAQWKVGKEAAV